ncbi:MAG TPA: hypothetical protein VNN73_08305 [Blastocatellia bacterium]|nr:hypothetical protein [Blastocatellia bacterium]
MAKRVEPLRAIRKLLISFNDLVKRRSEGGNAPQQAPVALKISGYNLVLMDNDGQVTWTREWRSGATFEFGPRYSLWIFCEYTNHSRQKVEISEYEIELTGEDGMVVDRFGTAFEDSVVVVPGESRVFSGQWRM